MKKITYKNIFYFGLLSAFVITLFSSISCIYANDIASTQDTDSGFLQNLYKQPAPQYIYATMVVAVLNSLYVIIRDPLLAFINFLKRKKKLREELWVNNIVRPILIDKINELVLLTTKSITEFERQRASKTEYGEWYKQIFKPTYYEIVGRMGVLAATGGDLYRKTADLVDVINDVVVVHVAIKSSYVVEDVDTHDLNLRDSNSINMFIYQKLRELIIIITDNYDKMC